MRTLLIVLTIVEILLVVTVLVYYLLAIAKSLRNTSTLLGKVAFGVRAIETQCEPIGPVVTRINSQLSTISGALVAVTGLADAKASGLERSSAT